MQLRVQAIRSLRVELHYFGRNPEAMAYRAELQALQGLVLQTYTGLDAAASVSALQCCVGQAGTADHLCVCGPAAMLDAALDIAARQGWPSAQVHHERFGVSTGGADDEAFTVELRHSGQRIEVGRQQTLLDACSALSITQPERHLGSRLLDCSRHG